MLRCRDAAQRLQQGQAFRVADRRAGPHIWRQPSFQQSQPPYGHRWPLGQDLVDVAARSGRLDHVESFVLPLGRHRLMPEVRHGAGEDQGVRRILFTAGEVFRGLPVGGRRPPYYARPLAPNGCPSVGFVEVPRRKNGSVTAAALRARVARCQQPALGGYLVAPDPRVP